MPTFWIIILKNLQVFYLGKVRTSRSDIGGFVDMVVTKDIIQGSLKDKIADLAQIPPRKYKKLDRLSNTDI
jgi:hypothetical protein